MDENVKKNYEYWCTSPIFDDATKSELKSLEGNEDEIFDRFYRELEMELRHIFLIVCVQHQSCPLHFVHLAAQQVSL